MDLSAVRTASVVSSLTMAARTSSMMVLLSNQLEPSLSMKLLKGMTMVYKLLNKTESLGYWL